MALPVFSFYLDDDKRWQSVNPSHELTYCIQIASKDIKLFYNSQELLGSR